MSTEVLLIIGVAAICGLVALLLVRAEPIPDFADPDVEDVSLEEFLEEADPVGAPGRHRGDRRALT